MPRISEEFFIRYDKKADRFVTIWPKWFIHSIGWRINRGLKLNYKIDSDKSSISFFGNSVSSFMGYSLRLLQYLEHKNKKKYLEMMRQNKEGEFSNLSERDKGYLFGGNEIESLKREIQEIEYNENVTKEQLNHEKKELEFAINTKNKKFIEQENKQILFFEHLLRMHKADKIYKKGLLRIELQKKINPSTSS